MSDILSGRRNAGPLRADRLAALTGTDIRIWLKGGDPAQRRAAIEKWMAEKAVSAGLSSQA